MQQLSEFALRWDLLEKENKRTSWRFCRATIKDADYTISDVVHILPGNSHIVDKVNVTSSDGSIDFDQSGEYFYAYVEGANLDANKVWPVFYYNGSTITSESAPTETTTLITSDGLRQFLFLYKQ